MSPNQASGPRSGRTRGRGRRDISAARRKSSSDWRRVMASARDASVESSGEDRREPFAVAEELAERRARGRSASRGVPARSPEAGIGRPSVADPDSGGRSRGGATITGCPIRAATGMAEEQSRRRGWRKAACRRRRAMRIASGADSARPRRRSSLSESACCAARRSRRICGFPKLALEDRAEARRGSRGRCSSALPPSSPDRGFLAERFGHDDRKGTSMSRSFRRESASKALESRRREVREDDVRSLRPRAPARNRLASRHPFEGGIEAAARAAPP